MHASDGNHVYCAGVEESASPLHLDLTINNIDIADVMAVNGGVWN